MRNAWWIVVLIAGIVVMGSVSGSVRPSGSRTHAAKKPKSAEPSKMPEESVNGFGSTAQAARARALENAQEKVVELVAAHYGDAGIRPTQRLLDPETLERYTVIREDGKLTEVVLDGDKAQEARYKVQLSSTYLREVERQSRNERVGERHLILARVLAGVLAVLLVVAGYLRLEEATRGYYTKLLRLGAFVLLALAAAGLWLTV